MRCSWLCGGSLPAATFGSLVEDLPTDDGWIWMHSIYKFKVMNERSRKISLKLFNSTYMHINMSSCLWVVERWSHSWGWAHCWRLLVSRLLNALRRLLLRVIVAAVDATANSPRRILVLTDLMVLCVVVSRRQLTASRICTLLLMACLRWTSTVTSHLYVTSNILFIRERFEGAHVTDWLTHRACWDNFRMLHATAKAATSCIARHRSLLSAGIVVSEGSSIGTDWRCTLGT